MNVSIKATVDLPVVHAGIIGVVIAENVGKLNLNCGTEVHIEQMPSHVQIASQKRTRD